MMEGKPDGCLVSPSEFIVVGGFMLRPYQKAWENTVSDYDYQTNSESTPGRELLSLLLDINDWLGAAPKVYRSLQGRTLYLSYPNAVFPVDDFFDCFGGSMADVSRTWPVCGFGVADNQETVCLTAGQDGDALKLVQHSLSGKSAEVLTSLCLQLDGTTKETAERFGRLLTGMKWQIGIAALNWEDEDFLKEQKLAVTGASRGRFCYGGLETQAAAGDCLYSLDFPKKLALWLSFLKDGFQPIEFEWLADSIGENTLLNRLEWELSLEEAMDQLGFRTLNREKSFELFDGKGNKLYYGADCRSAAERSLVKLLFPLNYQ